MTILTKAVPQWPLGFMTVTGAAVVLWSKFGAEVALAYWCGMTALLANTPRRLEQECDEKTD